MSRPNLRRIIAACLLGLSPAVLALPADSAQGALVQSKPWSQEGADEGRSQWLRGETQLTVATAPGLTPEYALARTDAWGECFGRPFPVLPVTTPATLIYEDTRNVRAVDLVTGDLKWKVPTAEPGEDEVTDLAVAGDKVIVGIRRSCWSVSDPDGALKTYDAATGRLLWAVEFDPAVSDVMVSGGTVLAWTQDAAWEDVRAYSAQTGKKLWTRPNCGGPSSSVGLFAVAGKVATSCGILNMASGQTVWGAAGVTFIRGDAPGRTNPQLYGQLANGSLVAYRTDGTRAWTSPTSRTVLAAGPVRLIVGCAEGTGVCAVDRATGARVWRRTNVTPTTATLVGAGLLVVDGAAFDAATGASVDTGYASLPSNSTIQASNARLIVESGRVMNVFALWQ